MKINDSSRQFIKDGLVGVTLALLIFLILTSVIWSSRIYAGNFFDYIHLCFLFQGLSMLATCSALCQS